MVKERLQFYRSIQMKIALLATGFPRSYKQTFDSWYHFLFSKYNVDMYIASWDKIEVDYNPHAVRHTPHKNQLKDLDIEELKDFYKDFITDSLFIDYNKFHQNRFPKIIFLENRDLDVMKITQLTLWSPDFPRYFHNAMIQTTLRC